jgi:hypothetical protein
MVGSTCGAHCGIVIVTLTGLLRLGADPGNLTTIAW